MALVLALRDPRDLESANESPGFGHSAANAKWALSGAGAVPRSHFRVVTYETVCST